LRASKGEQRSCITNQKISNGNIGLDHFKKGTAMIFVWAFIGSVLGASTSRDGLFGFLSGGAIGALIGWVSALSSRLRRLEQSATAAQTAQPRHSAASATEPTNPWQDSQPDPYPQTNLPSVLPEPAAQPMRMYPEDAVVAPVAAIPTSRPPVLVSSSDQATPPQRAVFVAREPSTIAASPWAATITDNMAAGPSKNATDDEAPSRVRQATAGGWQAPVDDGVGEWFGKMFSAENWPIKIGVLLLLIGVGAGLKYAFQAGWIHISMAARLVLVALAALLSLVWAWRIRADKPSFSLSVQGGALGVLLLTIYSALRVYSLLQPHTAFAMILAVVVLGAALALAQDSLALMMFASLGGFAAPILASSGQGTHVQLFSYYLILNGGILAVAFQKAWRPINWLGFVCTFGIGSIWGAKYYQPEFFATVEPFLVSFFLLYLAVSVLYSRRHDDAHDGVDATLVFGLPLAAGALQTALLANDQHMLSISSILAAGVYGLLAFVLRGDRVAPVLSKCFAALSIVFASLAIPLAFGARWTGVLWALEGAALYWLGLKRDRNSPQIFGLLLYAGAMFSFLTTMDRASAEPAIWNGVFLGASILAIAALLIGRFADKAKEPALIAMTMITLSAVWFAVAMVHDVHRFVVYGQRTDAFVALIGLFVLAYSLLRRFSQWPRVGAVAIIGLCFFPLYVAAISLAHEAPLNGRGGEAMLVFAVASLIAMALLQKPWARGLAWAHTSWLCGIVFMASWQGWYVADQNHLGQGFLFAALALPALLMTASCIAKLDFVAWPLQARFPGWRVRVQTILSLVLTLLLAVSWVSDGDPSPWTYLPVLNPQEIVQIGILFALYLTQKRSELPVETKSIWRMGILTLAFISLSCATLRAVHYWNDVPWTAALAWNPSAQSALAIVWSVVGIAAMLLGSARKERALWVGGAAVMGLVVLKLLLIDRQYLRSGAGVVAFIGVGLLLAVVGYFAPAPPKEAS
jgi:uncharacterized membrane protein